MLKYQKWLVLRNKCFIKPWMLKIQCWQGKFTIKVKIIFFNRIYFVTCLLKYTECFGFLPTTFSADSSYCWAFSISSMIRHSLNMFLREQKKKATSIGRVTRAEKYLNGPEFHKRLRNCFEAQKCIKSF